MFIISLWKTLLLILYFLSSLWRFGRRLVVLLSVLLLFLCGVGVGFSPNMYVYMFLKFMNGISISGFLANGFVIGKWSMVSKQVEDWLDLQPYLLVSFFGTTTVGRHKSDQLNPWIIMSLSNEIPVLKITEECNCACVQTETNCCLDFLKTRHASSKICKHHKKTDSWLNLIPRKWGIASFTYKDHVGPNQTLLTWVILQTCFIESQVLIIEFTMRLSLKNGN